MAKGISIHIGVNEFDPAHYGYNGKLRGCENDARAMHSIAATRGYESILLLTQNATAINVLRELSKAAERLSPGDILLLTYAGHGSQVPDANGDEDDKLDETWCLYDRMLIDDELYRIWAQFLPGVRIVMVSDSCHSGTMAREYLKQRESIESLLNTYSPVSGIPTQDEEITYRTLPITTAEKIYNDYQAKYDEIQWSGARSERSDVGASVLLISACQDNQTAADGRSNGLFTSALLNVWNSGSFTGSYYSFYKEILGILPPSQSPRYYTVGLSNPAFERQSPFTISASRSDLGTTNNNGGNYMSTQTKNDIYETIEERLAKLKSSRTGSREFNSPNGNSKIPNCKFELDIPRDIIGLRDEEVYDFLQGEGCDVLMEAYMNAKSVTLPRGGGGSVGCHAESGGGWGCKGEIHFDF